MPSFGVLKKLDPRVAWPKEAHNFTPWLAENLEKLGEVLGLDLEMVRRESDVGDFCVDILAKDLGRDRMVIIENQLEPTDHTHLGQLITYAAGLNAGVVIWISRELREEHRQAIDWLNGGRSGLAAEFFGVVVELIQVDDSNPAVHFRPVAYPNDWSKRSAASASSEENTPTQEAYRKFFQRVIDELREKHKFTNARVAMPGNWYSYTTGVRGFSYSGSFALGRRIRTEIYIDVGEADENEQILEKLRKKSETLEKEFGDGLVWENMEKSRACRVACYREGSIQDSAEKIEEYHDWMIDRLLRFKRVFGPILPKLIA